MFWVITPAPRPARSNAASARWAGLGSAAPARNSRRIAHAFARTSADPTYFSKVKSIGSYRVHTPPGERKSGIPDSVDTPAPVNATVRALRCSNAASGDDCELIRPPYQAAMLCNR